MLKLRDSIPAGIFPVGVSSGEDVRGSKWQSQCCKWFL